jgi:hypothetical protein
MLATGQAYDMNRQSTVAVFSQRVTNNGVEILGWVCSVRGSVRGLQAYV